MQGGTDKHGIAIFRETYPEDKITEDPELYSGGNGVIHGTLT
jgi:hypothetical protein